VKCGEGQKALEHFQQMQQGVQPDPVTFVVVLNACASLQALEEGMSRSFKAVASLMPL